MLNLMKTTFYALVCASTVLAVPAPAAAPEVVERQFDPDPNLIGPFSLVTSSENAKYDGLTIIGRHIGAAINLAIPGSKDAPVPLPDSRYNTYYLNTTYGLTENPNDPGSTRSGVLVYPIYEQYPTAVTGSLSYNSSSNIAQLWLGSLNQVYDFGFDSKGNLGLRGVFDRWFVCPSLETNYGLLEGIAWRLGTGEIDDKDCVPINIKKYDFPTA